jgi:hypothetical protein
VNPANVTLVAGQQTHGVIVPQVSFGHERKAAKVFQGPDVFGSKVPVFHPRPIERDSIPHSPYRLLKVLQLPLLLLSHLDTLLSPEENKKAGVPLF